MLSTKAITLAASLVLMASACAGGSSSGVGVDDPSTWKALVDDAVSQAMEGGASEAQIAILREARDSGGISLESARDAQQATVDCMTEAGLDATYVETEGGAGELPQPGFRVRADRDGEVSPVGDACETQESRWVSHLYQTQPRAVEARNANVDEHMPDLLACLSARGISLDSDASRDEVYAAATNEAIAANAANSESCLSESGIGSL
jgi:hypothetical protein